MEKLNASDFVVFLQKQLDEGAGYIMGSRGQNPRTGYMDLSVTDVRSSRRPTGYYYAGQYSGKQLTKALYWREHSKRVFDCNGLIEGFYELVTGVNINSKARYNYAQWCDPKGKGTIPTEKRVPGAAVFWSDSGAGSIHHVGYLEKPVMEGATAGDWYILEARGVMYGVVRTKLSARKPNYWGIMTKLLNYDGVTPTVLHLGDRVLKNGMDGSDVAELQTALIEAGYSCGKWGADGDFGDATEMAVMAFQTANGLEVDGIAGEKTVAALLTPVTPEEPAPEIVQRSARIVGGNCWVRAAPTVDAAKLGVANDGDALVYQGETSENGWHLVEYKGENGWVSGKYSEVI